MTFEHVRWEKCGRTYRKSDTGEFVWWSSVSSRNVDLGNGEYAPYVWDAEKQIARMGDAEFRLVQDGFEFHYAGRKCATGRIKLEGEKNSKWEDLPVTVRGLKVTPRIRLDSFHEHLEIEYVVAHADYETKIQATVGGSDKIEFGFESEAKKNGKYRVLFQADVPEKGIAKQKKRLKIRPKPLPPIVEDALPSRFTFLEAGFDWKWNPDESSDRAVSDTTEKFEVRLSEKDYLTGEKKKIFPDTWGPYGVDTSQAGYVDSGTYSCESGATDYVGLWGSTSSQSWLAEQWDISSIDASWDITNVEVRVYCTGEYDSPNDCPFVRYGASHGENNAATDCALGNNSTFFNRVVGNTPVYANPGYDVSAVTPSAWTAWMALSADAQTDIEWCRDNAYSTWAMGIYMLSGGDNWMYIILTRSSQANEAQIQITYTAGGGTTYQAEAADGLSFGDSTARIATLLCSALDGLNLGEARFPQALLNALGSDGASLSDASTIGINLTVSVTDGVVLGDLGARTAIMDAVALDGVSGADSGVGRGILRPVATDGTSWADVCSSTALLQGVGVDGLTLGESIAVTTLLLSIAQDGFRLSETLVGDLSGVLDAIAADGIRLGEATGTVLQALASALDGLLLSDQATYGAILTALAQDEALFSDAASRALTLLGQAADTVTIGEAATARCDFTVSVSDGFRMAETIAAILQLAAVATDGFTMSDVSAEVSTLPSGECVVTFSSRSATVTFIVRTPGISFSAKTPTITFSDN